MLVRYPARLTVLLTLTLFIVSCGQKPEQPRSETIPKTALADFTIRAASLDPVPGWEKAIGQRNEELDYFVSPEPAVTLADVESAQETVDLAGHLALGLHFNAAGAERMRNLSSAQMGKFIAIVLDGRVVSAPRVSSQITDAAVMTGGGSGFTREEIDRIVGSLKRK